MGTKPIDNPTEISLTREDLTLLGSHCMSDLPLMVETDRNRVRIVPNKNFARYTTVMAIVNGVFFVGFWFLFHYLQGESFTWLEQAAVGLFGIFTLSGLIGVSAWRQRYLLARSPLVEVNQETSQVSILGGRHTFDLSEVVCLVAFSALGEHAESPTSELQLMVEQNGQRQSHLIITSPFGAAWIEFGKVLKPFAAACDLPVVITEAQGSSQKEFVLKPL